MHIKAKITNIPNNRSLIEIDTSNNKEKKYYNVPTNNADTFISNYKKNQKQNLIIANILYVAAGLGSIFAANACTKSIKTKSIKWITNICAGIAGSTLSVLGSSKIITNRNQQLLNKHQAIEINKKN